MTKYLVILITLLLAGCGDYKQELNDSVIESKLIECQHRGYSSVNIKFIFGYASSYYTCM